MIDKNIDAAQQTREEAEKLLEEYRKRLKEARAQSEEIIKRAREAANQHEHESRERGRRSRRGGRAHRARHRGCHQARARRIRREVTDLTVMATEKVTRKALNDADQRRLVEEALGELDFSGLSSGSQGTDMEELAQVYARSLYQVALEKTSPPGSGRAGSVRGCAQ